MAEAGAWHPRTQLRIGVPRALPAGRTIVRKWLDAMAASGREELQNSFKIASGAEDMLAAIALGSPFLWRLARSDPRRLATLLRSPTAETVDALCARMRTVPSRLDIAGAMSAMRQIRSEFALAVALADLSEQFDIMAQMAALTDFADAAVKTATRLALQDAAASGKLAPPDHASWENAAGLFVLALGKHGARELNYSSDIDLVVFYGADRMPVRPGREVQPIAVAITQRIVKLLHEITPEGYVFRTDLRLRPDPASNPIAMPTGAAMNYYESLGQNWERAAMIKARIVAGDEEAGSAFLAELQPFIWRKYFDYAAIADIHAMKRQINAHKGFGEIAVEGHDIKLGRGGIREIEFFVQTQQLVFGGRRPALRGPRTLDMLPALEREAWITPEAVAELGDCYRILRAVEHRLQMLHDEQTQRLPAEAAGLDALANFCGTTPAAFRSGIRAVFETVARHYARLFEEGDDLADETGNLVFTGAENDPDTIETLRRMGFGDPEAASEMVRGWHFGRRPAVTSPRAREVLTEMTPALLTALGKTGDGDAGMRALDELFGHATAAVELMALLKSNPALLDLFATMLGSAPRLAETVARRPHALDHLIDPDFARRLGPVERKARILAPLQRPITLDAFLDVLRDVVMAEKLAVGARMISGVIDPVEAGPRFTLIAEAAIESSLLAANRDLAERFGELGGLNIAVLGFGKLGGREMTAASDLDLVIIYDAPDGAVSNGPRQLEPSEYCARLTQRLISTLSAPTARGVAFEIDLRLRPSGNKGPVALALWSFLAYQENEAETWEQMALLRARPVAGDPAFCGRIATELARLGARRRDCARILADISQMRSLIAREKGDDQPLDFKIGKGGLVDIEFIAQALALTHAADAQGLISPSTAEVLAAAKDAMLLDLNDAAILIDAWRDWTSLSQASRSWFGELAEPVPASQMRRLAAVLGLPDARSLSARIAELRMSVRACFEKIVGPVIA